MSEFWDWFINARLPYWTMLIPIALSFVSLYLSQRWASNRMARRSYDHF